MLLLAIAFLCFISGHPIAGLILVIIELFGGIHITWSDGSKIRL